MFARASSYLSAWALALPLAACSNADGGAGAGGAGAGGADLVASSSAVGGGGEAPCTGYASEPLGVETGDVLDPTLVLSGLVEGSDVEVSLSLGELRDCDGRSGVDAVLIIAARQSCATCRREAETLAEDAAGWAELGVRTVVLLMEGDVAAWREAFALGEVVVLADPGETLDLPVPPSSGEGPFSPTPNGTPLFVVLDPRTGRIHDRHLGADYDFATLLDLAATNRAAR